MKGEFESHIGKARADIEHQLERARADFEQVNDRINQRTGRNLLVAIAIGLSIGAVLVASLIFIKSLFLLFVLPVALLGIFEFSRALQGAGRRVDIPVQLVAAVGLLLSG